MSLAVELALDRIEAALAAELPAHVRAFARAYAGGGAVPPAPAVMTDAATLATAERARAIPELARRGTALWRLAALAAIEREVRIPAVVGWAELAGIAAAREGAARRRWGRGFLEVAHEALGVTESDAETETVSESKADSDSEAETEADSETESESDAETEPEPDSDSDSEAEPEPEPETETETDSGAETVSDPETDSDSESEPESEPEPVTVPAVLALWSRLTALPPPSIVLSPARPRAFAVRPGEAIVVVRPGATVAAWTQVAHELGHAWVSIAGHEVSRTVDEAVAISAARTLEHAHPTARAIRARQHAIARRLATVERALYAGEAPTGDRPPPWALVRDPGAQAAYVAAHRRAWSVARLDELTASSLDCAAPSARARSG